MIRWSVAAIGAVLLSLGQAVTATAAQTPVTTCGQVVTGNGFLVANLDCTGIVGPGVVLADRARLDLRTFTLSGGDGDGVLCEGSCRVSGRDTSVGGTITGFTGDGIVARSPVGSVGQLRLYRVNIVNNGGSGARVDEAEGAMTVGRSVIEGNGGRGLASPQRMRVSRSTIAANALEGIHGDQVYVLDSLVELNGIGVDVSGYLNLNHSDVVNNAGDGIRLGASLQVFRAHITGNGDSGIVFSTVSGQAQIQLAEVSDNGLDGIRVDGAQPDRLRLRLAFVRRNGRNGVVANRLLLHQSRIDDNAFHGVYMPPGMGVCTLNIDQYSLIGNGTDASCGVSVTCADIASCETPANVSGHTVCGTSYDSASGFPGASWGVCDED
jgi:hypothetical protein